mgnify:CR=1 FL=1
MRTKHRPHPQQRTLQLPPRLYDRERTMLVNENHMRLASDYVKRQGWRFEKVIDHDEQRLECLAEMCRVLPKWEPSRGKLSTFLNRCFYYHLSKLAAKQAHYVAMQFSAMACGGESIADPHCDCHPDDDDIPCGQRGCRG